MRNRAHHTSRRVNASVPVGIIILIAGGALLARQLGFYFPDWIFSWEMLLITIGLVIGFANGFRDFGWLIVMAVGVFFLADDFFPDIRSYIWPAVLILIGLAVIFKPRKQPKTMIATETMSTSTYSEEPTTEENTSTISDVLSVTSVFGGTKRNVLSKKFKGGEVVSIFGGADINLTQADFKSPIKIEVVAVFGGAKLIVPANWEIRTETVAILGGIDDKREPAPAGSPEKVIILEGFVMFGGVEITSY